MKQRILLSRVELQKPVSEFLAPVRLVLCTKDTVQVALQTLQGRKIDQKIFYFYVLDPEGKLVGVVSTRNLVLSSPDTKVGEIMDPSVAVLLSKQTMHEAMEALDKLRLLALPVVDEEGRLLGMIDVQSYVQEPLKELSNEMRKNIFQFIGLSIEEGKLGTPWKGYKARMPWIFCNMISGLMCAAISKAYEGVLTKVIILAMFIPLILTLCESISMQAMTQSFTILRSPHLLLSMVKHRLTLETKTVVLLSTTSAVVVGLLSYMWGGGWILVLTLGITLLSAILISAMVGTLVPVGLKFFKKDPKIASGPVVLMIVDVAATTLYLSLAYLFLLF
jgi:magnesium transporter